jgi:hypothetical protein
MLQESPTVTFDIRDLTPESWLGFKVYVLFLLVALIMTSVKLLRIWRTAPPFKLSRQSNNIAYLKLLETSSGSISRWLGCSLLAWGLLASISVTTFCNNCLTATQVGRTVMLFAVREFSVNLSAALLVALFLFLARWHILARIERLRD